VGFGFSLFLAFLFIKDLSNEESFSLFLAFLFIKDLSNEESFSLFLAFLFIKDLSNKESFSLISIIFSGFFLFIDKKYSLNSLFLKKYIKSGLSIFRE
jgi:hypothetical protein